MRIGRGQKVRGNHEIRDAACENLTGMRKGLQLLLLTYIHALEHSRTLEPT